MLATQLNHYITNNEVVANGVIQLDHYIINIVSGIKIIIILGPSKQPNRFVLFLVCFSVYVSMSSFLLPSVCLSLLVLNPPLSFISLSLCPPPPPPPHIQA